MFDIPPYKKINEMNAIVVDQQSLIRDALKSVLLQAGVNQVVPCSNAFEATSAFRNQSFELVFVSFNLSRDKDGFHLLEELKFKGHITNTTIVVFLSADTGKELVNSVVEMQPDDFWIKPFDTKSVTRRLDFLLTVKEKLYKPLYFADQHDYSRAIYYSDRLLAKTELKEYHPRLYRLKGRCLFAIKEYADAEKMFSSLTQKYKHNWVNIGLTMAMLRQEKLDKAQELIDQLKQRNDSRRAVHDLLAEHYVEKDDFAQAYTEIVEAAQLAPRNIERNKRTWDLARLNHDRAGQLNATLNMAKYAKNSIHDSPELNLNVVRAYVDYANVLDEDEAAVKLNQADKKLAELMMNPKYYRELKSECDVLRARIFSSRGEKMKAENLLRKVPSDEVQSLEFNLDFIKAMHETGNREDCLKLLEKSKELAEYDSFSGSIMNRLIDQEIEERSSIHFTPRELTKMAAAYHEQQKYVQAMSNLDKAFRLCPANSQLAMNIVKVAAALKETDQLSHDDKRTTNNAVMLLKKSDLDAEEQKMFNYLREQIGEINALDLLSTSLS